MRILLLVDIQNDFCPGGALAVPEGNQVVEIANKLMASGEYELVIASKDYHPADHGSFAANHPGKEIGEMIELAGLQQHLWPIHCVQNTPGADFHPDLKAELIDKVVFKGQDKNIDSYSAFFDNGKLNATELNQYIEAIAREHGINPSEIQIDVMGLATDYCVKATAIHAKELGYETRLVLDGCRAVNITEGDDLKALREMQSTGIDIVESRNILPEIERSQVVRRDQELRP